MQVQNANEAIILAQQRESDAIKRALYAEKRALDAEKRALDAEKRLQEFQKQLIDSISTTKQLKIIEKFGTGTKHTHQLVQEQGLHENRMRQNSKSSGTKRAITQNTMQSKPLKKKSLSKATKTKNRPATPKHKPATLHQKQRASSVALK